MLISLFQYMWAFKASFTVLLQPKCSWCEFSPPLVVHTLHILWTFLAEGIITKFTHPLTLSVLGGGGGGGSDARMTNSHLPFRNFLFYDAQMLWLSVFIFKTCSDQILAKLINLGVAAALFSSRGPKNLQNEKKFLHLEIAKIDIGG